MRQFVQVPSGGDPPRRCAGQSAVRRTRALAALWRPEPGARDLGIAPSKLRAPKGNRRVTGRLRRAGGRGTRLRAQEAGAQESSGWRRERDREGRGRARAPAARRRWPPRGRAHASAAAPPAPAPRRSRAQPLLPGVRPLPRRRPPPPPPRAAPPPSRPPRRVGSAAVAAAGTAGPGAAALPTRPGTLGAARGPGPAPRCSARPAPGSRPPPGLAAPRSGSRLRVPGTRTGRRRDRSAGSDPEPCGYARCPPPCPPLVLRPGPAPDGCALR